MIIERHRKKPVTGILEIVVTGFVFCCFFGSVHAGSRMDGATKARRQGSLQETSPDGDATGLREYSLDDDQSTDDDEVAGEDGVMYEPPLQEDEGHLEYDEEDESEGEENESEKQGQDETVTKKTVTDPAGTSEKEDPSASETGKASEDREDRKKSKVEKYQPAGFTAAVGGIGFQYGITNDSVGGFKLGLTYGYRLTDWIWFDAQVNFTFGGSCVGESPVEGADKEYACGGVRGFGIEAIAGAQWKFYGIKKWQAPVVPFVRAGLGVVAIVSNGPNDGAALVARGSGGIRYHFFPWFAVGGELGATLGPAFRNHLDTGLYAALDVLAGAEFHF